MLNVTWRRFDQSAKQLIVGHTTMTFDIVDVLMCRFLSASQLQAIDARRVFPCFDEPDKKAVFNVSIVHPPGTVGPYIAQRDSLYL